MSTPNSNDNNSTSNAVATTSTSTNRNPAISQRDNEDTPSTCLPTPVLKRVRTASFSPDINHLQLSLSRMASHETSHVIHHEGDEDEVEGEDKLSTHSEGEHEEDVYTGKRVDPEMAVGFAVGPPSGVDEVKSGSASTDSEKTLRGGPGDELKEVEEGGKKKVEIMDQTNLLPVKQVIIVFVGLSCALFCSLLDQTIVSTALPTLGKVFNRADISSWVGTAYFLSSTALQGIYGRLSDIFGRKLVLLACLVIFWCGSLACALSQTMIQLIVFRAIAGIGGGGVLTLVMIIVSDVVSLKERGKYQGILGGVVATANSIGPVIGGIFTEKVTWRWCFYLNLPLIAASMFVVVFLLPLKRTKGDMWNKLKKVDYYGSFLTLAWTILILVPLSWGGTQYAWDSAGVLAPMIIGGVLFFVFIFVEWKLVPLPIIPMTIFSNGTVNASMAATFFSGICFYGSLYELPQFFQVVLGVEALRSGVLLLPLILVQTACSFFSGYLVSKTGDYCWNLYVGFGLWTVGLGLLSTIDKDTSLAKLVVYQMITGIGAGSTFQTSLIAIQSHVPRADMAVATSARNCLRMLGGTISISLCGAILNNTVKSQLVSYGLSSNLIAEVLADPTGILKSSVLSSADKDAAIAGFTRGIRYIYYFLPACAGISFVLTVFFVKAHSLDRDDDAKMKEEAKIWAEKQKQKHSKKGKDGVTPPETRRNSAA